MFIVTTLLLLACGDKEPSDSSLEERLRALEQQNTDLEARLARLEAESATTTWVDQNYVDSTAFADESAETATRLQLVEANLAATSTDVSVLRESVDGLQATVDEFQRGFDYYEDLSGLLIADLESASITIEGANLHLRSGTGHSDDLGSPVGLGNLIIGYDEPSAGSAKTGSHNIIVGPEHSYSGYGAIVVGEGHTSSAGYATVVGGLHGSAEGEWSTVVGGSTNSASGAGSVATGGYQNDAAAAASTTVGGTSNEATDYASSVLGGSSNEATGSRSVVVGGTLNTASGRLSVCLGGESGNVSEDIGIGP